MDPFWRLKVNMSSPHGEELEGLWSKWPFPREFITQFTKKPIEKNQFIGQTWKGLVLWNELDFLLSLSWLFVVHTARWDYSNLIPLRWIPRVNIVQMCPWNNFTLECSLRPNLDLRADARHGNGHGGGGFGRKGGEEALWQDKVNKRGLVNLQNIFWSL